MNESVDVMMTPFEDQSAIIVSGLNDSSNVMYHSFNVDSKEDKIKLFNACSSDGTPVKSMINKEIIIKDVVVLPVELEDDGGTRTINPRTVIISKDGTYYTATSWGVYRSIQKLNAIFGGLHFEDGLKVVPKEVSTKKGFTINLVVVE